MKAPHNRSGSTFIAVIITISFFSAILGVIMGVTRFHSLNTNRTVNRAQAIAYADGVLESLFEQWRVRMVNATNSTDRTDGLSDSALAAVLIPPDSSTLPPPQGVTLASWSVTSATPMLAPTTRNDGRPVAEVGTTSRLRTRLSYVGRVTVDFKSVGKSDTVTVERTFVRAGRNLFDNFFFGTQKETEFHPGPPMYVDGTVYAGGNLYTAHDSLHFLTDVNFLGNHFADYRSNDSRYGTAPDILNGGLGDNWDTNNPPRKGAEQKLFDTRRDELDPNFLDDPTSNDTDSDNNRNNNGFHELIEEAVAGDPDPLQLDPATSERLSQNADYRIYINAANSVTIYRAGSASPLGTSNSQYVAIKNALTTGRAIRDVRDGDNVRITTVDVSRIKAGYDAGTIQDRVGGDGIALYIADTSVGSSVGANVVNSVTGASVAVTSNRSRGVKLVNGGSLPSAGLTIASPNSVYIQGDYNTGTTASSKPPSTTATTYTPPQDKPNPMVSGYNRIPSAVVGDAVNLLSNAWNDANSLTAKSTRKATSTTINTAIIAGNVPTKNGAYSGGIENFPRFHEDWSNRYLTIYGSLALLYASQQATKPWTAADYTPPNRRWYFDPLLLDSNPPGFRVARVYERGQWTIR